MKKLSKKKRKKLKEKEMHKPKIVHGEPYSKHKIRICEHISIRPLYSRIIKIGNKYVCTQCSHEFTEDEYNAMNSYINYLYDSVEDIIYDFEDTLKPDPVKFYYEAPNKIVEIKEDRKTEFGKYDNSTRNVPEFIKMIEELLR